MCTRTCGVRVLRWMWTSALRPKPSCVAVKVSAAPRCFYRNLGSVQNDGGPQVYSSPSHFTAHDGSKVTLTLTSLADMGFSEAQAELVQAAAGKSRGRADVLSVLFELGFNPSSVVKILDKCPELYSLKHAQLQQRVDHLRRLGLLEGSLQRVISHYPQILSLPVKRVRAVSRLLREKCQFSSQQVTDILRDSPHVLQERLELLEYMFQYAYFRMGCRQAEMVKAKLFRLPLEELRCRHSFLERRGLYQTPDKKGQTLIVNPRLKDFISISEETYLSKVALATQEEFDVFRKLVAREQEEEEGQGEEYSSDEEEDDDDDEEEEKEEKESHNLNSSYRQRKKRDWESYEKS